MRPARDRVRGLGADGGRRRGLGAGRGPGEDRRAAPGQRLERGRRPADAPRRAAGGRRDQRGRRHQVARRPQGRAGHRRHPGQGRHRPERGAAADLGRRGEPGRHLPERREHQRRRRGRTQPGAVRDGRDRFRRDLRPRLPVLVPRPAGQQRDRDRRRAVPESGFGAGREARPQGRVPARAERLRQRCGRRLHRGREAARHRRGAEHQLRRHHRQRPDRADHPGQGVRRGRAGRRGLLPRQPAGGQGDRLGETGPQRGLGRLERRVRPAEVRHRRGRARQPLLQHQLPLRRDQPRDRRAARAVPEAVRRPDAHRRGPVLRRGPGDRARRRAGRQHRPGEGPGRDRRRPGVAADRRSRADPVRPQRRQPQRLPGADAGPGRARPAGLSPEKAESRPDYRVAWRP